MPSVLTLCDLLQVPLVSARGETGKSVRCCQASNADAAPATVDEFNHASGHCIADTGRRVGRCVPRDTRSQARRPACRFFLGCAVGAAGARPQGQPLPAPA